MVMANLLFRYVVYRLLDSNQRVSYSVLSRLEPNLQMDMLMQVLARQNTAVDCWYSSLSRSLDQIGCPAPLAWVSTAARRKRHK